MALYLRIPTTSSQTPNQALQQTAGHDSIFLTTAHRCPAAAELGRSAAEGLRVFYSPKFACPCCGILAFVVTADGRRVVLFCIRCGSWYLSADNDGGWAAGAMNVAVGPELRLEESCSVLFPPSRWATAAEVEAFGWGEHLDPVPNGWRPEEVWAGEEWESRLRGVHEADWHSPAAPEVPHPEPPPGLLGSCERPIRLRQVPPES
jgi:hypothetical protein